MTKKAFPFYLPLFAVFPVLGTFFPNMSLFPLRDLFRPLGIALLGGVLLWLCVSAIFRSLERGAFVSIPLVILFWAFAFIKKLIPYNYQDNAIYFVLVLALVAVIVLARIKPPTRVLNRFSLFLVAIVFFQIGLQVAHALKSPVQTSFKAKAGNTNAPDVYYIILDGYGRADELKRNLGYDNTPFIQELEKLGFYIPPKTHSNYCQTQISLASSLNYDMIPALLPNATPSETNKDSLNELINHSGVVNDFKRQGYATAAVLTGFPSFWVPNADVMLEGPQPVTLFEATLIDMTPVSLSVGERESQFNVRRRLLLSAFQNLQSFTVPTTRPRFVFAHILAPHPPFVFDKDGNPKRKGSFGYYDGSDFMHYIGTPEDYRAGYVGQVQYINKLVLETVTKLIKESRRPPIIILQGDHGSKLHLDQSDIAKTDVRECFSNLQAFYVPEDIRKEIDPDNTPVNIFRILFTKLFGANLPKLPNRSYYSPFGLPFQFTDVTKTLQQADNGEGGRKALESLDPGSP